VAEDFEWFTRAKDYGIPMAIFPDILLFRRIHSLNISLSQPELCNSMRLQIFKESIDRKRKLRSDAK